jgi:hypothetical protein
MMLADEKIGLAGPAALDCLLFAGHAGVSIDGGKTVVGFTPVRGAIPFWQMSDDL